MYATMFLHPVDVPTSQRGQREIKPPLKAPFLFFSIQRDSGGVYPPKFSCCLVLGMAAHLDG